MHGLTPLEKFDIKGQYQQILRENDSNSRNTKTTLWFINKWWERGSFTFSIMSQQAQSEIQLGTSSV